MEPTRRSPPAPELSYVLVTDELATVRGVLAALGRQTRPDAIELVLVAPGDLDTGAAPANLGGVRVERCDSPISLPVARALGIRAATAPVVFVGETHSFPEPEMVERLLTAFGAGWDGVVPALVNANPGRGTSCAGFLLDYGRWGVRRPAGPISDLLVYNAAFRREALLALGDGLADAISSTDVDLERAFRVAGRRVGFEPAARIRHLNVSQTGAFLRERLHCGLLLGRLRAQRWSWSRRLLYAAAAPLVPLVLLARSRRALVSAFAAERPPWTTPLWITVALITRAAGEALGYLGAGAGSERAETEIELHRTRYVAAAP